MESRKQGKKSKRKEDGESDEELMEESDDLDEGEEVDYISGSSRSPAFFLTLWLTLLWYLRCGMFARLQSEVRLFHITP